LLSHPEYLPADRFSLPVKRLLKTQPLFSEADKLLYQKEADGPIEGIEERKGGYIEIEAIFLCISCNKLVQEGIFNETFISILLKMVLPFALLAPALYAYHSRNTPAAAPPGQAINPAKEKSRPVVVFSLLIGIGMGGFVDGILLHQILQWHQMIKHPAAGHPGGQKY
jgi:hypothetical protein